MSKKRKAKIAKTASLKSDSNFPEVSFAVKGNVKNVYITVNHWNGENEVKNDV